MALGAVPVRYTEPRDLVIVGAWFLVLLLLAATDLDQKLLPDLLTLPLIPITLVLVVVGWDPVLASKDLALLSAVVAGLGAPALLVASSAILGGGLGAGDVKLAVSLGLMAGIVQLIAGLPGRLDRRRAGARGAAGDPPYRPQDRHPVRPDPAGGRDLCGIGGVTSGEGGLSSPPSATMMPPG